MELIRPLLSPALELLQLRIDPELRYSNEWNTSSHISNLKDFSPFLKKVFFYHPGSPIEGPFPETVGALCQLPMLRILVLPYIDANSLPLLQSHPTLEHIGIRRFFAVRDHVTQADRCSAVFTPSLDSLFLCFDKENDNALVDFLRNKHFSVRSLTVEMAGDNTDDGLHELLLVIIKSFSAIHLQELTFSTTRFSHQSCEQTRLLHPHAIRDLAVFSSLKELDIPHGDTWDLDDLAILDLASSLPRLERVRLATFLLRPSPTPPSHMTIGSVLHFLRTCPNLTFLGLIFDGSVVVPLPPEGTFAPNTRITNFGAGPVNFSRLMSLEVGISHITAESVTGIAEILHAVLPNLDEFHTGKCPFDNHPIDNDPVWKENLRCWEAVLEEVKLLSKVEGIELK
ncbi:hypothetical protein HYDPIDRAFT_108571 [Hydnomerulius pinastri MD-312]|nr:hypothetical protein HYDPIDRAFT_108571 [Hydnomerulius pinastri MD-312]